MGATSSGLRERTVRWLASAGSVASVFLLLTGSRAGLASAAAAVLWTTQTELKPTPAPPSPRVCCQKGRTAEKSAARLAFFSHSYRGFSHFAR